jgi:hypothetical protein
VADVEALVVPAVPAVDAVLLRPVAAHLLRLSRKYGVPDSDKMGMGLAGNPIPILFCEETWEIGKFENARFLNFQSEI